MLRQISIVTCVLALAAYPASAEPVITLGFQAVAGTTASFDADVAESQFKVAISPTSTGAKFTFINQGPLQSGIFSIAFADEPPPLFDLPADDTTYTSTGVSMKVDNTPAIP